MVYHIFNGSMTHFTSIIEGILANADKTNKNGKSDHYFYILIPEKFLFGKRDDELIKFDKIFNTYSFTRYIYISHNFRSIFGQLKKVICFHDRIVFHGINFSLKQIINLIVFNGNLLNHFIIIEWGVKTTTDTTIKHKFKQKLNKYLYSKYKYIITMTSEEKELIILKSPNANAIVLNYITSTQEYYHNLSYDEVKNRTSPLKIMVSHSGWEHNDHLITFKQIENLKNENIIVICPLCYGNKDYITHVINCGKEIFGNKFTYFTELKERVDYASLISQSNIYITNAKNQTGLFASTVAVSNGVKVFARENILRYFNELGCDIFEVDFISTFSYDELLEPLSEEQFYKNREAMVKLADKDKRISVWKMIYEE